MSQHDSPETVETIIINASQQYIDKPQANTVTGYTEVVI